MDTPLSLVALLARSESLVAAWNEALPSLSHQDAEQLSLRESLALDASSLTLEHGQALRDLVGKGLEASALALLRVQHEALLRAAWVCFAASESAIHALGAPHTPATLKRANSLPLANVLLDDIEKSRAPATLRRGLREFRDLSWAGVNSYAHAGLLPLGRVGSGHPETQLIQAVQVSNAHSYSAYMIMSAIVDPAGAPGHINLIAVSHPGCMLGIQR